MLVSLLIPNPHNMTLRDFISLFCQIAPLSPALPTISSYYSKHMPMWQVLQYYGEDVGPDDTEQQISCLFPQHGTADVHKSARYYGFSRENDENEASVFCHKCHSRKTSLWLIVDKLKADGADLIQCFEYIEQNFRVPFPRDLLCDLDTDDLMSLDPGGEPQQEKLQSLIKTAVGLYNNKPVSTDETSMVSYRQAVFELANARL